MLGHTKNATETPEAIHRAMECGEITLIDVREPQEHAAERIPGALLFPLSSFDPAALPAECKPIVFHCGSGKRSATALDRCLQSGVEVRSHMGGGIGAWRAAGLPTVAIDPATGAVRSGP